ncbi:hypothetical protein JQC92_07455 [Shewanella sp. 202IG2-18]|uniref:hypothetical protein n=1 Tax=Parashewanella hymeniacidonis TaxID=2807618 RepID=UPI0019604D9D|nr:hypothetical protein [Parashewanella hymeniacidonis]MBM7071877.1 hypothetical protein [Parashewanella hymeniacidonis]
MTMAYIVEELPPWVNAEDVKFSINFQPDASSLDSEKGNVFITLDLVNGAHLDIKGFSGVLREQVERLCDELEQCYIKKMVGLNIQDHMIAVYVYP